MSTPTVPATTEELAIRPGTLGLPPHDRLPVIPSSPRVEGTRVVVPAMAMLGLQLVSAEVTFRAEFERHPNLGYWGTVGVSFTPESVRVNGREVDASALVDAFAAYEEASSLADNEFADELVRNAGDR